MGDLFHYNYPPMLGPLEDWPAGSPEWAERLGFRIKIGIEKIEDQGIDRLIPWIRLALDTKPAPWEVWPVERPCHTPDRYFQYATCTGCDDLAKLIAAYKGETDSLVRALKVARSKGERVLADENQRGGQGGVLLHRDSMKEVRQGNTSSHLLRRLARVAPDILEAYQRGEHKTPTAAARAAGIKVDTSPLVRLKRAWKAAAVEERRSFLEWIKNV